ncbi:MAG: beta-galactosidase trimerization domain-containing protein, partial [Lentisphaeria bacterium]|nr:beta-galactosidase trimerization domain-containing protein [Lentisphaeria bacterium]
STVVRFTLKDESGGVFATWDQPTTLGPMASHTLTQTWPVPTNAPDYIVFSAELWEDGHCLDREEGAVVIWTPAVIARGPRLAKDGLMLSIDGQPRFYMGCQNYWGQHNSVTARSPRMFNRDFMQMREHNLRWSRCFLPIKSESDARVSDAIVQLAQKHGIVLYHTPNLSNTVEEWSLTEQRKSAGDIGRRYRDVPGLALDICNEPSMKFAAAGFAESLGHAPKPDGDWSNPQVYGTWRLVSIAQRRWAQNSRDAIKAEKPNLPVSVGWSQGWSGGAASKDPLLASLDLDFTDRHYYGPPMAFPSHVKDVDLRVLGKPLIVGECGAKNHPTFKEQDPWRNGDDDESYSRRFLYLVHHAFGFGATALLSWHWRDPMEGIFPCGLIHQSGTPRPTAARYRDMARVFGILELVDNPPDVVLLLPDYLRHTPKRGTLTEAAHHVTDALLWHGANMSLLPDSLAGELPANVKLVIYPLPYVVSDDTLQALAAFVQRGGTLWLSGDISRDSANPGGGPIPGRLEALCGVRPAAGLAPEPMVAGPATLPPIADGPLAGQQFRPAMALELTTARAWFNAGDTAVVVQNRLGAGMVAFTADPLEISSLNRHTIRVIYGELLKQAGAQTTRRADTPDDLTTFRVPGRNGTAWVFWNNGQHHIDAIHEDITIPIAADAGACLILDHNGQIIALEAHGDVRRGNKVVAKLQGHGFVVLSD